MTIRSDEISNVEVVAAVAIAFGLLAEQFGPLLSREFAARLEQALSMSPLSDEEIAPGVAVVLHAVLASVGAAAGERVQ